MAARKPYFTTRDLLLMAVLAALGGVASTYINAVGDFVQSILGFAGGTQWAAGFHVLWLVLAVGLTGKTGAGTVTGVVKGAVEVLSGNSHGLLVLLIDVVAGLLVDLGFLPFRRKDALLPYCVAGGAASASNVVVFQLFASLPADVLAYGAILIVMLVAGVSGVLLAGLLGRALVGALRRAGVVKDQAPPPLSPWAYPLFFSLMTVLTVGLGLYLRQALRGPAAVQVGGAVAAPYAYPAEHGDIPLVTAEATLRNTTTRYRGAPLREVIARAQPQEEASLVLVRGSDGYAFFVSMEEVRSNASLLLAPGGEGQNVSFDLVGPENAKAWVRGLAELTVVGAATLPVQGALDRPGFFDPGRWQFDMDSTRLDVGLGPYKYQGAPLGMVLQDMGPQPAATEVVLQPAADAAPVTLPLEQALNDSNIRVFTIIHDGDVSFAVATMDGQVISPGVTAIEVR